jgi:hypothetical protein
VFQICSVILWSLDDYYIYASCIVLISAISLGVELYETRKVRQLHSFFKPIRYVLNSWTNFSTPKFTMSNGIQIEFLSLNDLHYLRYSWFRNFVHTFLTAKWDTSSDGSLGTNNNDCDTTRGRYTTFTLAKKYCSINRTKKILYNFFYFHNCTGINFNLHNH